MAKPLRVRSLAEVDEAGLTQMAAACNISASAIEDVYYCTPLQLNMISETRNETLHLVLRFGPTTSIEHFCDALRKVVALNAPLRTRLVDTHSPLGILQVVVGEEHVNPTEDRTEDVEAYLQQDQITPTHTRSVFGVPLFRSARFDRVLVVTMNHAIMDYWSITQLLSVDVPAVFLGRPPISRPPFKSFVAHCCLDMDEAAAKAFWKPRFTGAPAHFPAPRTNTPPSSDSQNSPDSAPRPCVTANPNRKISVDWKTRSIPSSHVPYFLEAAWALTAATYTGTRSVAYGYVLSGRSSNPDGVENNLGPTISEVPIQVNLPQNLTVDALIKGRATSLRQLQQQAASGLLHYGLDEISALSAAAKTAAGFQMLFNIRPELPSLAHGGKEEVALEKIVWLGGFYPLQLVFTILDDGVMIWPRTDTAVVGTKKLSRILDQFGNTLRLLAEASPQTKIDDLPLLDPQGRADMESGNQKALLDSPVVEKSIHALFHERVRMQSQAMAVEAHDGTATYRVLDQHSDRLAHALRRKGVSREQPVAVIFEKSLWSVVAMLAILKAGGVCVPVDKNDSDERKSAIIASAGAKLVLTSVSASGQAHAARLPQSADVWVIGETSAAEWPESEDGKAKAEDTTKGENLAYILKGVQLEHRNLTTTLLAHPPLNANRRTLQWSSYASASSVFEVWGSLLTGACVCIPEDNLSAPQLSAFMRSTQVNFALLPPQMLRAMSSTDVPSLQTVLCIGEHADIKTYKIWSKAVSLFNGWGTCETSMLSTVAGVPPRTQDTQNIGAPVASAVWIVNPLKTDELVPFGAVGELVVTGPGVARGYLPGDTRAASFISPPPRWATSGEVGAVTPRFFRTGDLARYNLNNNSILLIGRRSNRVKLGPHQIQLEEVETVIASCDEVSDVATAVKIVTGRTQLVAVVCLANPQLQSQEMTGETQKVPSTYTDLVDRHIATICMYTQKRLASEKIPTLWIAVQQLPRTTSNKLDRGAIRDWLRSPNSQAG
jgi:non-ribosomal peptide synthetase component F